MDLWWPAGDLAPQAVDKQVKSYLLAQRCLRVGRSQVMRFDGRDGGILKIK